MARLITDITIDAAVGQVIGLGITHYALMKAPCAVRQADVEIYSRKKCRRLVFDLSHPDIICAGVDAGGRDSCQVNYSLFLSFSLLNITKSNNLIRAIVVVLCK